MIDIPQAGDLIRVDDIVIRTDFGHPNQSVCVQIGSPWPFATAVGSNSQHDAWTAMRTARKEYQTARRAAATSAADAATEADLRVQVAKAKYEKIARDAKRQRNWTTVIYLAAMAIIVGLQIIGHHH